MVLHSFLPPDLLAATRSRSVADVSGHRLADRMVRLILILVVAVVSSLQEASGTLQEAKSLLWQAAKAR
jgi:hypothetical protein